MWLSSSAARRTALVAWLEPRRRGILLAMLVLLHLALLEGVGSVMERLLMMVHIGLFFLWQPFVRKEQRLAPLQFVLLLVVVAVMAAAQNAALLMLWCMMLGGLIGGKVFVVDSRWNRVFHLAALAYLAGALLLFLLPRLLPPSVALSLPVDSIARFGLPLALLAMLALLAIPVKQGVAERREVIDFAYSVFVFLLLAVLVLGSLAGMLVTGLGYVESLLAVLLTMAMVLLFLGWSWNPRGGFSGWGVVVSRYLFSAGLPFELWVETLAAYPESDGSPEEFVGWSCESLLNDLNWVNGIRWSVESASGAAGRLEGDHARFRQRDITFDVYSGAPMTPAVIWQFNVMLQLLGEFYRARVRERQLREIGRMQAVYETGSRLTHDVKNILQSLNALCLAAAQEDERAAAGSAEFQGLVRRQLPTIAKRLGQTLEKLGNPAGEEPGTADAENWWLALQERFNGRNVVFLTQGHLAGRMLPANLFTTATENLIQNALDKRQLQPNIAIDVAVMAQPSGLVLEVCDDGTPVPPRLASRLGMAPVNSENGLGIGLYQVARLANASGYRLQLAENEPGRVCFRLSPAEGATQA